MDPLRGRSEFWRGRRRSGHTPACCRGRSHSERHPVAAGRELLRREAGLYSADAVGYLLERAPLDRREVGLRHALGGADRAIEGVVALLLGCRVGVAAASTEQPPARDRLLISGFTALTLEKLDISTDVRMCSLVGDDRCDLLCLDLEHAESLRRSRLSVEQAERLADATRARRPDAADGRGARRGGRVVRV